MKEDVLLLFETAKARHEAAVREVHNILDVMVKQGLAKRLEDNNDDQDIIIIASPAKNQIRIWIGRIRHRL